MKDNSIKVVEKTNETLKENIIRSGNRLKEIVEETEQIKSKADREVKSYFNRHKIIDYLVYVNLIISPILFIIICYLIIK